MFHSLPLSLLLLRRCSVNRVRLGPALRQAVLVMCMRDELGSCAPGSFTAVALFYIYGAAAGPAVARCESHDSSAGNRDGPVILAPRRLHVTPPALLLPPLPPPFPPPPPPRHSPLTAAPGVVPTDAHTCTQQFCSFYGQVAPSVFQGPHPSPGQCVPWCPYLILLIRPHLYTYDSILGV